MRRYLQRLIIFSSIFFAAAIFADANSAFTTVNVTVPDQSSASFQQGLQTAFSQLMIQLSNNPHIMLQSNIQAAAKNAMQYVQSYQYEQQQSTTILQIVLDSSMMQNLIQPATPTAQPTTPTETASNATEITVGNIQNMIDYENALQVLRAQSGVTKVSASEINANQVVFTITLSENADQFLQNLSSDAHFQVKTPEAFQPVGTVINSHQYSWVGTSA